MGDKFCGNWVGVRVILSSGEMHAISLEREFHGEHLSVKILIQGCVLIKFDTIEVAL